MLVFTVVATMTLVGVVIAIVVLGVFNGHSNKTNRSSTPGSNSHHNNSPSTKLPLPPYNRKDTYISPKKWEIGVITEKPSLASNLCDNKALYPPQDLSPDYGTKMAEDCSCTQFIRSP